MPDKIEFKLNRKPVSVAVDGDRKLLWVLRTDFALTGPKYGCGEGHCGACTVLVNNKAKRSCQLPIKEVKGKEIVTIEGLAVDGRLHPVQKAFIEHDALQCGFCTPGMVLNAVSLLTENTNPTESEIVTAMNDNLCRCGAHIRIIRAIRTAAEEMRGGRR